MIASPRLITRIALFSALAFVVAWACAAMPNVNLVFFVFFSAGYLWGALPGALVGIIGMGLFTTLNPFGPAALPVSLAQMLGAAACGVTGAVFVRLLRPSLHQVARLVALAIAGAVCTCAFYLPVSAVDAWVFQPFWPRFISGLAFSLISLVSNIVIFPLLFTITRHLYDRERSRLWKNQPYSSVL